MGGGHPRLVLSMDDGVMWLEKGGVGLHTREASFCRVEHPDCHGVERDAPARRGQDR
jgi:hypothetical protein